MADDVGAVLDLALLVIVGEKDCVALLFQALDLVFQIAGAGAFGDHRLQRRSSDAAGKAVTAVSFGPAAWKPRGRPASPTSGPRRSGRAAFSRCLRRTGTECPCQRVAPHLPGSLPRSTSLRREAEGVPFGPEWRGRRRTRCRSRVACSCE